MTMMNDTNLTYREVMDLAVNSGLTMTAEQRKALRFRRVEGFEGGEVYSLDAGRHMIDADFGNLIVLDQGRVVITGAPTLDAAMTAARCALLLGVA